ncbi:MAG: hypothetical protein V3U13_00870 [Gemmatimonadota bacterium]
MELSKKTTILFSPQLHLRLTRLAKQRQVSLGELVRHACKKQYGFLPNERRLDAVRRLAALALPLDDARTMREQAVLRADQFLP